MWHKMIAVVKVTTGKKQSTPEQNPFNALKIGVLISLASLQK